MCALASPLPQIVAHRGDPMHEVENTLAAIRRARDDGASMIEVDARLTADGAVVLLHDATTYRLWGTDRPVREQMASELDRGIPLLAEALAAAGPARLLIDLPEDDVPVDLAAAAAALAREADPVPAFCGGLSAMRSVREADPSADIWLTWKSTDLIDEATVAALRPHAWNPSHELVDATSIAHARSLGLAVSCWTVDDPDRARQLAAISVDSITSNRAGELRRALHGT